MTTGAELARTDRRLFPAHATQLAISILFIAAFFDPAFGEMASAAGSLLQRKLGVDITPVIYPVVYYALHWLPLLYFLNLVLRTLTGVEFAWWRAVFWSATVISVLALPATALADALSGPAAGSGLLHHLSLLALLFACLRSISRETRLHSSRPSSALLLPAMASIFSLGVMAAASIGAFVIADGEAYCIASPDHKSPGNRSYGPVASWQELRGGELATERTGYKDSSRWYFHAVLIYLENGGVRYRNWSFSRFRWDELDPTGFIDSALGACEPKSAFLSGLAFAAP